MTDHELRRLAPAQAESSQVLAQHAQHHQLDPGQDQDRHNDRRPADRQVGTDQTLDHHEQAQHEARSTSVNHFFGGGHGDFSVVADPAGAFLYFFLSTYNKDVREQGVAIARMAANDLDDPVGKVFKWHQGRWNEPGVGGHVTPIFPAMRDWHQANARAFWGPAVHWNTHIQSYVMVMNLSVDSKFAQGGIHLSVNPRLDDPEGWTQPIKLLGGSDWYPQVVGMNAEAKETDRLAGRVARLFVKGSSRWEVEFFDLANDRP